MGLQQATEQKRAKQTCAEGKSMIGPSGQTKKAKSKESESQKAKDAVKCKDVDWKENNRQANEAEGKSKTQRGAQGRKCTGKSRFECKMTRTKWSNWPNLADPENTPSRWPAELG